MAKEIVYRRATEAEKIAAEIIPEYHEHLESARILCLFTNKEQKSHGKLILGKTSKLTGVPQFLSAFVADGTPFDFLIVFNVEQWMVHADDPDWQMALVDHELCHADLAEDGEWTVAPHDVEEFTAIVRRRGLWKHDLEEFGYAVGEQLPLDALDPTSGELRRKQPAT